MSDVVETILACPECDSAALRTLSRHDREYYCRDCGARFDDGVERAKRSEGGPTAETMLKRAIGGDD